MVSVKRIRNIIKYGVSEEGRKRKKADKWKAREKRFEDAGWKDSDDILQRPYRDYDAYLEHQAAKFSDIQPRLDEKEGDDVGEFRRRFELCEELAGRRIVLCLAARLGTEVQGLLQLGYFAIGLDLEPGPKNAYVLHGDFHNIVFPDASVDAIYNNAMDHVFDLDKLMAEIDRLLVPGGIFIADLIAGLDEGFVPGRYESMHWHNRQDMIDRIAKVSGFEVSARRDMGHHRRDEWHQIVFKKPA